MVVTTRQQQRKRTTPLKTAAKPGSNLAMANSLITRLKKELRQVELQRDEEADNVISMAEEEKRHQATIEDLQHTNKALKESIKFYEETCYSAEHVKKLETKIKDLSELGAWKADNGTWIRANWGCVEHFKKVNTAVWHSGMRLRQGPNTWLTLTVRNE